MIYWWFLNVWISFYKKTSLIHFYAINISYLGASGSEVYELVSSTIEIITSASFGSNFSEPLVQSIAAELFSITVITPCLELTDFKDQISSASITIQTSIVYLIKEINKVQSEFVLFTGEEFNLSNLNISLINETNGEIIETSVSTISSEETEVKFQKIKNEVWNKKHFYRIFK